MKLKELCEGVEPKLPGAPAGIKVMSMDQFLALGGDGEEGGIVPGEMENDREIDEGIFDVFKKKPKEIDDPQLMRAFHAAGGYERGLDVMAWQMGWKISKQNPGTSASDAFQKLYYGGGSPVPFDDKTFKLAWDAAQQGLTEAAVQTKMKFRMLAFLSDDKKKEFTVTASTDREAKIIAKKKLTDNGFRVRELHVISRADLDEGSDNAGNDVKAKALGEFAYYAITAKGKQEPGNPYPAGTKANADFDLGYEQAWDEQSRNKLAAKVEYLAMVYNVGDRIQLLKRTKQGVTEGVSLKQKYEDKKRADKDAVRFGRMTQTEFDKKWARAERPKPVKEATKLPASARDLKGQELTDYFDRIRGTETGKVDKKGNAKYVSGKTKTDRYKLPYVHRSSVISYYSEEGKKYDVDAIKAAIQQRPKSLLKQNEKMKHSNGEFEQFFNIGFAALVGLAMDETTGELIVVNTCPGAGACKVDCFAMKGGKIQFAGPWLSDARILTYLLNDPDGFKAQLMSEIKAEYDEGVAGDKKFPNGWSVTVRWHDAGDFFSPEYMDLAFDIARAFPGVKFYAYTKMASAALADKPDNFIINWSEGANTAQEKQVKAQDPALEKTKNSRIVPEKLFYDLLKKDAKGNLEKTPGGAWQPADAAALKELKQRLAKAYSLSAHSILSYDEWMSKNHENGMKWNVIVAPGEGDVSANSHDVLSTLLLRH